MDDRQKNELLAQLDLNNKKLEKERELINQMAKDCINSGKKLSDEPMIFRQERIVDELVINEEKLRKLYEEIED